MPGKEVEREAFTTHYNYASCLAKAIKNITLSCSQQLNAKPVPHLDTKENLIKLTKRSLQDEFELVKNDNDYSYASTCWLPVKVYYLLFNVLLTIEYLIKLQREIFNLSHDKLMKEFTRKLENKEISFSDSLFNQVFDKSILSYREASGANLSTRLEKERMFKLAMKKVACYKLEGWQRSQKIKDFRSKKAKTEKAKYLESFKISIFEFPYYMRIRANYRDFAFIDGVTSFETAQYFNAYYSFAMDFCKALENLKKQLIAVRNAD